MLAIDLHQQRREALDTQGAGLAKVRARRLDGGRRLILLQHRLRSGGVAGPGEGLRRHARKRLRIGGVEAIHIERLLKRPKHLEQWCLGSKQARRDDGATDRLGVVDEALPCYQGCAVEGQAAGRLHARPVHQAEPLACCVKHFSAAGAQAADHDLQRELRLHCRQHGRQFLAKAVAPGTHGITNIHKFHGDTPLIQWPVMLGAGPRPTNTSARNSVVPSW